MAKSKFQSLISIENARSMWDKVITTTPVVLTVIATILAGLSSSEMSLAQYHRSLSAQNQAKAADQWAFYQAKRSRQEEADNTRAMLTLVTGSAPAGPEVVQQLFNLADTDFVTVPTTQPTPDYSNSIVKPTENAYEKYLSAGVPTIEDQTIDQPRVELAMKKIAKNTDASDDLRKLDQPTIDRAIAVAQANADAFDAATKPITDWIDHLVTRADAAQTSTGPGAAQSKHVAAEITASRLSWDSRRNAAEAKYNQTIAQVLEVQVAFNSLDSDRHRDRGKFFFYGMLAMQAGVTMSTLSLAVKNRNALWVAAALVGMGAVAYAGYVYLFT